LAWNEEKLELEMPEAAFFSRQPVYAHPTHRGDYSGETQSLSQLNRQNLDDALAYLIVRMNRFIRFYFKRVFESQKDKFQTEAKNISLDELGFLVVTEQLGSPKKSEVIAANLFEPTTGTEILRRLIQMGLITQSNNPHDKRSKVLNITPKGSEVIAEAMNFMNVVSRLMGNGLEERDKLQLNLFLTFLNVRHGRAFFNQREFSTTEWLKDDGFEDG
jgi:DNA-binding MarR family transcriptional regulator